MSSERIERINSLISRELAALFVRTLDLPRAVVLTVTSVDTSADLSVARVWVSVLPALASGQILDMLEANRPMFQRTLNRKLVMRKVPKVTFSLDQTEERAARVESLLDDLKKPR